MIRDYVIATPMRIEWLAVRSTHPFAMRTGMGAKASRRAAPRLAGAEAVVLAGFAAGMADTRPGDIVVASEVRAPDGTRHACPDAEPLAAALRGLLGASARVVVGPVQTVDKLVRPAERARLADEGVLAAEMEAAYVLAEAWQARWAMVRVVSDAPGHELVSPRIVPNGIRAYRTLKAAAPALHGWLGEVAAERAQGDASAGSAGAAGGGAAAGSGPVPTPDGPGEADLGKGPGTESGQDGGDDVRPG
ncbi:1-hydroxy-2-methyl-2-butenyl 4-diphosphate reductase [Yinghuangia seranimata]|uniref:phosphorylase family protein n=1 Tax=Yinghuangia seranimata TaxID=408067 RepID=UPI00248ABD8C|nr:1-hydroxy-2-methyl-2-butenyl 4-diphosphate reductase [Yinghuangia seranimata]MDI2125285.1 1-hydroxy-2-methyl-2-butenyl 4-diphosphate reductase [Yinghuangia seranimata]